MKSFRTVISCDYPIYKQNTDGENVLVFERQFFPIDLLNDRSVTANSHIATHPLLNGDTISDHMYRDPVSVKVSGKFSLNGRNANNTTYQDLASNNKDRLACIQEVFEFIKNNALLCTITTIESEMDNADPSNADSYSADNTRFITRRQMALTSIGWTEKVNILEFSFDFREVISVDLDSYEIDITDVDLPFVEEPKAASIGTVLYESGSLPQAVMQILKENGYITNDFLRHLAEAGQAYATLNIAALIVVAAAVIIKGVAFLAGILGATGAIFPVGTIVAIGVVAICAIGFGVKKLIDKIKKNNKAKKIFDLVNGSAEDGLERLIALLDKVGQAINKATNGLLVYNFDFDSDEQARNVNNQYCFTVGGEYYYVTIQSCQEYPYFKAQVFTSLYGGEEINDKQLKNAWCVITNLQECDQNHIWFTDSSGEYKVFLVNVNLNDDVNQTEGEKINVRRTLSSYTVWVCRGSMKDQLKIVNDTIIEQLDKEGYKK